MVSKFKLNTAKSVAVKEAISRTMEIANNYAGELSIEMLPLSKIELDPDNKRELVLTLDDAINGIEKDDPELDRKKQDLKSLESLAKTIQDGQLINPIYVYRYGNKCRLIAGERRTLASAIAGKKEIIARIASQRPVGTRLRVLQWVENHERSELKLSERIASLEAILHEYFLENKEAPNNNRITAKLLGDLTGMSMTQARRYLLILQANDDIKKAISEGKLENVKLVELICSAKNEQQQSVLLSAALSGDPFESIARLRKTFDSVPQEKTPRRGRKKLSARLGKSKPAVIKLMFDILVSSSLLKESMIKQVKMIDNHVQWENIESVENAFKKIISLLEHGV